jgi:hypothetical protein
VNLLLNDVPSGVKRTVVTGNLLIHPSGEGIEIDFYSRWREETTTIPKLEISLGIDFTTMNQGQSEGID